MFERWYQLNVVWWYAPLCDVWILVYIYLFWFWFIAVFHLTFQNVDKTEVHLLCIDLLSCDTAVWHKKRMWYRLVNTNMSVLYRPDIECTWQSFFFQSHPNDPTCKLFSMEICSLHDLLVLGWIKLVPRQMLLTVSPFVSYKNETKNNTEL